MTAAYICLPQPELGSPAVHDHTADLGIVAIDVPASGVAVHVRDAALAREWAAAWTRAAELLEAAKAGAE